MSNVVRVRVELRQWHDDRDTAFKKMFTAFKRACTDNGVMHAYKQHESYESKSRKRRRKKRESEIQRLKAKLKENFMPQGKKGYEQ